MNTQICNMVPAINGGGQ